MQQRTEMFTKKIKLKKKRKTEMSELCEIPHVTSPEKKAKKLFVSFVSKEKCQCGANFEIGKIIQFDPRRETLSMYIACLGECIHGTHLMRGCNLLNETEKQFSIPNRNYVLLMDKMHNVKEQNFTAMIMKHIEQYAANQNYTQVHICGGYDKLHCAKCEFADKCEQYAVNQKGDKA